MKLFISWSGDLSKELAEAFRTWIPSVIQSVRPYFTPNDIEKGARWNSEISKELKEAEFGIICLTKDNLEKPWLLFEAGALSKSLEKSNVCPLIFGLDNSDLSGPLAHFQATQFKKSEVRSLVKTINEKCGDTKLIDSVLNEVFEMWWPKLEENIDKILHKHAQNTDDGPNKEVRTDRDLLEEILSNSRMAIRPSRILQTRPDLPKSLLMDLGQTFVSLKRAVIVNSDREDAENAVKRIEEPIRLILQRRGRRDPSLMEIVEEFENIDMVLEDSTSSRRDELVRRIIDLDENDDDDEIPF